MQPLVQVEELSVSSSDLAEIDTILNQAIMAGDPLIATDHGNKLSKTIVLKGIALAKLLYGMRSNWHLFRAAGIEEEFLDFIEAHMIGVAPRTADKYASMYESVFANEKISDELKAQLTGKPIKTLILLTAAVREGSIREGGEEDELQLEDVVLLDHEGVREMVQRARGRETSTRARVYGRIVKGDNRAYPKGTIVVFGPGTDIEAVGWLKLDYIQTESGKQYVEKIQNILGLEELR